MILAVEYLPVLDNTGLLLSALVDTLQTKWLQRFSRLHRLDRGRLAGVAGLEARWSEDFLYGEPCPSSFFWAFSSRREGMILVKEKMGYIAAPLKIYGGTASPVNPILIKWAGGI